MIAIVLFVGGLLGGFVGYILGYGIGHETAARKLTEQRQFARRYGNARE